MSIKAMSRIWETSPARGVELLIELALADFADDDGRCWPSIDRIAAKARCGRRHVIDTLKKLEAEGRLTVEDRAGPHRVNVYVLGGALSAPVQNRGRKVHLIHQEPSPSRDDDPSFTSKQDVDRYHGPSVIRPETAEHVINSREASDDPSGSGPLSGAELKRRSELLRQADDAAFWAEQRELYPNLLRREEALAGVSRSPDRGTP